MASITKDSKRLLYILYKEYKSRRNNGTSKRRACYFESAKSIQQNFMPDELLEDVEEYLRELHRHEYVNNFYADNTIYDCYLSDAAISELEDLPKDTLLSVADFISKFIP